MVVILACLSLILTAGGGAMALYGADLIRSESGLALTQSGITMLSAGLVLAGLTTAVVELRRMRRLMELEEPLGQHPPAAAMVPMPGPVVVERSAEPPASTPSPPAKATPPVDVTIDRPVQLGSPGRFPPSPPVADARQGSTSGIPAEARAILSGIAAKRVARPAEDPRKDPAEQKTVEQTKTGEDHDTAAAATAEKPVDLDPAAVAAGAVDTPAEGAAPSGERKMLATYNSGGITYFMFSDGSIEADMAGGRFRFTSMDELRGYIDTGKGGVLVEPAATVATS